MEENKNRIFCPQDIIDSLFIINEFTENLNDAKTIFASLLVKHNQSKVQLDDATINSIIDWAKNYTMIKERMVLQNEGIKPN